MQKAFPWITLALMLLILAFVVINTWAVGSVRKDLDQVKKYAEFVAA